MKFALEIGIGNAAFEPDATLEISRILRELSAHVRSVAVLENAGMTLYDQNGNCVGVARFVKQG